MANGYVLKFKYTVIVDNHWIYRGAVEQNSSLIHYGETKSQIGFYIERGTTQCSTQIFDFFVARP